MAQEGHLSARPRRKDTKQKDPGTIKVSRVRLTRKTVTVKNRVFIDFLLPVRITIAWPETVGRPLSPEAVQIEDLDRLGQRDRLEANTVSRWRFRVGAKPGAMPTEPHWYRPSATSFRNASLMRMAVGTACVTDSCS